MGSTRGYSYNLELSSADLSEIKSLKKSHYLFPGEKDVILEFRTRFLIRREKRSGDGGGDEDDVVLDTERYDIIGVFVGDNQTTLAYLLGMRLLDYWMTFDEISSFCARLMTFVEEKTAENASLRRIPVVVDLDVCTVQQPGESYDAALARAIVPSKLYPLYLFPCQTVVHKFMNGDHMQFLLLIPKVREENADQGSALMGASCCRLCSGSPRVADLITKLECNCAFHNHCIVGHLEMNNLCPTCNAPQFDESWLPY